MPHIRYVLIRGKQTAVQPSRFVLSECVYLNSPPSLSVRPSITRLEEAACSHVHHQQICALTLVLKLWWYSCVGVACVFVSSVCFVVLLSAEEVKEVHCDLGCVNRFLKKLSVEEMSCFDRNLYTGSPCIHAHMTFLTFCLIACATHTDLAWGSIWEKELASLSIYGRCRLYACFKYITPCKENDKLFRGDDPLPMLFFFRVASCSLNSRPFTFDFSLSVSGRQNWADSSQSPLTPKAERVKERKPELWLSVSCGGEARDAHSTCSVMGEKQTGLLSEKHENSHQMKRSKWRLRECCL